VNVFSIISDIINSCSLVLLDCLSIRLSHLGVFFAYRLANKPLLFSTQCDIKRPPRDLHTVYIIF